MTKDCSLNYQLSTWKLQAQYIHVVYKNCSECQNKNQFVYTTCPELVIFLYWICNSMNNLLSYCGLLDARIRASDKDLPIHKYSWEIQAKLKYLDILENGINYSWKYPTYMKNLLQQTTKWQKRAYEASS